MVPMNMNDTILPEFGYPTPEIQKLVRKKTVNANDLVKQRDRK